MKTYKIEVVRISYGCRMVEVMANNLEEAEDIALDKAGDFIFTESSADYELSGLTEEVLA